jgi:hypothetical protein
MVQKSETPAAIRAGASRKSLDGSFRDPLTLAAIRVQHLIASNHVRPDLAVMLAALAFGGGEDG